jgi:hypothetical protein
MRFIVETLNVSCVYVYITINIIILVLEPLCWVLAAFFLIPYTVGRTPWMGDQPASCPLPTHRTTQNKHRYIHDCSVIRTHEPIF